MQNLRVRDEFQLHVFSRPDLMNAVKQLTGITRLLRVLPGPLPAVRSKAGPGEIEFPEHETKLVPQAFLRIAAFGFQLQPPA